MSTIERTGFQHANSTQMARDNELLRRASLAKSDEPFTSSGSQPPRLYRWPPRGNSAASATDDLGRTILHRLATNGNIFKLRELIAAPYSTELDARDNEGNTPLLLALTKCKSQWDGQAECALALIEANCDLDALNAADLSALHLTLTRDQPKLMSALLKGEVDREQQGINGNTPLHVALYLQKTPYIKLFLTPKNLRAVNNDGDTVFHTAAGVEEVVALKKRLNGESKYDLIAINRAGRTALHEALMASDSTSARALIAMEPALLEVQDSQGNLPLHTALANKNLRSLIPDLTTEKTKIVLNGKGESPFLLAFKQNATKWLGFVGTLEIKDTPDNAGNIPLHLAAAKGCIKWIRALATEETLNAKNYVGNTACHFACANGHYKIVNLLKIMTLK